MKNFKAFSLIELSIVILIIGILVAGVTQSSRLLRQVALSSAKSLTTSSPVHSISGLVSWYEPTLDKSFDEFEASDNSTVSKWYDINPTSSSKIDLIQTDATRRPTYTSNAVNGLPSLKFNGVNTYLKTNGFSPEQNSSSFSFFAVTQNAIGSVLAYKAIYCSRYDFYPTTVRGWVVYSYNNQYALFIANGGPLWSQIGAQPIVNAKTDILTITYDRVNLVIYKNGVNPVTQALGFVENNIRPTSVGSNSGCDGVDNYFFNGYISEIILYNRNLKTDERQDIEKYLAKKWAIKI